MPLNIEAKAKVRDLQYVEDRLRDAGAEDFGATEQEDVFLSVPRWRLKLRCDDANRCELIYYCRPDGAITRSCYFRSVVSNREKTLDQLRERYGVKGVVRKHRHLFMLKGARVHLDRVEGAGSFVEVEVPISSQGDEHRARYLAKAIMRRLDVSDAEVVQGAYQELLARRR